uniref:Uncharacterized protein n=1 Tax=Trichogramma kaykai TaxID=54128 RepID=A0ABD2X9V3_9HYME
MLRAELTARGLFHRLLAASVVLDKPKWSCCCKAVLNRFERLYTGEAARAGLHIRATRLSVDVCLPGRLIILEFVPDKEDRCSGAGGPRQCAISLCIYRKACFSRQ